MPQFGSFALLFALVLSAYCLFAGILALRQQAVGIASDRLAETARRAGIATWAAVTAAAFALLWAALNNDFSVAYIFHHSNRDLPTPYKFAALWSGQEGSLLFWAFLLSTYGLVLRLRHKVDVKLTAYASTILAAVQLFFLLLLNFAAPPFAMMRGEIPADGNGLNPLLQYPEMVIHPPMLYLGYVGFAVPFAFALGALIMKYPGEKWIHITRRWTMVTWGFLTCGIFLGAHWAYSVLGWGGYWGWDPVENASLMPWLTGTAFLHSVMMQEKRGMLKTWNVWLIFSTFMLSILGTFLTRSGVVSSVHAFAQSSIGDWFMWFLGIILVVCIFFYVRNRDHLKSDHRLESLLSRESSFLFQNLVLLASCFAVLWGTLFPILSEWIQGHKVTVGGPFFNRVNIPIAMFLLLLTAVGPLLAWRRTSGASLQRNFAIPVIAAVVTAGILMALGVRPWEDVAHFYSLMAMSLAALVAATIVSEFVRGGRVISRHTGQNLFSSMVTLTRRNTRRYGGYIVHFGVVVIVIGLAGAAFNQEKEQEMGFRDQMQIGPYTLVCDNYTQEDNPNYSTEYAILNVYKNGKPIGQMFPERRFFKASQQASTIVANHSTPLEDLYVIYAGKNLDTDRPIIKVFINPLVMWIWTGVWVLIVGTVVAMVPSISAAAVPQTQPLRPAVVPLPVGSEPVGAGD
jgi:cytochrome c-type biogenesis protein CcmF